MVGVLHRPHGLKGELVMEVITDFPERLQPGVKVFVGERYEPRVIDGVRTHAQGMVIKLSGIDSPESAGRLRSAGVYVKASDRPPLPEGTYYHHEIIGFELVDENEAPIGKLREIMQTGANDVYVVIRRDGTEVLLPVIPGVILGIDKKRRQIRVGNMPGLLD